MVEIEIYEAENENEFNTINQRFLDRLIELNILNATDNLYARKKYVCTITGHIAIPIKSIWRDNLVATLTSEEIEKVWTMNDVDNASFFPIVNDK